jgi:hypothetical protein
MEALIAFETESICYVLPRVACASGILIVSQPVFVDKADAALLPRLKASGDVANWVDACNKPSILIDRIAMQRIYCWWMGLVQHEKDQYFAQVAEVD